MIIHLSPINPNALEFGFIVIRWYSLAYIFGILATIFWLKKANQKNKFMSQDAYENWITWAVLSIILGGRLGYVLFYNLSYFIKNPLEIFAFWHGGMSFHGGLCGSIFGMYLFARKYKIDFLRLTDQLCLIAPVGLFFGRIANFINMELYGRPTSGNFGVVFPNVDNLPRHPSQLYEAFLEGFVLFLILQIANFCFNKTAKNSNKKPETNKGFISGLFLLFYGIFRLLVENFRQPDEQMGFLFLRITAGQIYSIPLIIFGIILIFLAKKTCLKTSS